MKERSYAAPVVVLLMLLPFVNVGSYCALVTPGRGASVAEFDENGKKLDCVRILFVYNYRWLPEYMEVAYFPLEQIDRRIRPEQWTKYDSWPR